MEITVDTRPLPNIDTDALITYAFEQDKPVDSALSALDGATGGALSKLAASGELTGKMLEATLLHYPQGLAAQRLLILGAGKKDKFGTVELRMLARAAVRTLKSKQIKRLTFFAREGDRNAEATQTIGERFILATF